MINKPETAEHCITSTEVFNGRLLRVVVDEVRLPSGRRSTREVVRHRGAIAAVPLNAAGEVVLVRQYRYPVGRELLEIPAGTLDGGEDPLQCLQRELAEEIGLVPQRVDKLTSLFAAPGWADEVLHIYLARDLAPCAADADWDENITVKTMPLDEALAACRDGRICDGKSVSGLFLAADFLRRSHTG